MFKRKKKLRNSTIAFVVACAAVFWFLWSSRSLVQRATLLPGTAPTSDMLASRWSTVSAEFSDGRRQIVFPTSDSDENPGKLLLKSSDAPDVRSVPIPAPSSIASVLGITPENTLIALARPDLRPLPLFEIHLFPDTAPIRVSEVLFPANTTLVAAALSPNGERIAWSITGRSKPLLNRLLGRFIPRFAHMEGQTYTRLILSRQDGADMREIGTQAGDPISDLYWRKDGRRICFFSHSAFYTVPID